jgi:hypothetical protein
MKKKPTRKKLAVVRDEELVAVTASSGYALASGRSEEPTPTEPTDGGG